MNPIDLFIILMAFLVGIAAVVVLVDARKRRHH